jgi:hypothetical protein
MTDGELLIQLLQIVSDGQWHSPVAVENRLAKSGVPLRQVCRVGALLERLTDDGDAELEISGKQFVYRLTAVGASRIEAEREAIRAAEEAAQQERNQPKQKSMF